MTPKATRGRHRRRWRVAAGALCLWTLGAWYGAVDSHRSYERCEAHPGPGIMICTDGSAAVWVLWAIPVIIACVVALVVLIRRMMTSVDEQVDDFVGSGGPPEKPH